MLRRFRNLDRIKKLEETIQAMSDRLEAKDKVLGNKVYKLETELALKKEECAEISDERDNLRVWNQIAKERIRELKDTIYEGNAGFIKENKELDEELSATLEELENLKEQLEQTEKLLHEQKELNKRLKKGMKK